MGEAILSRLGGGGEINTEALLKKSTIFSSNGTFTAPKAGNYSILMCGGGGSSGSHHGIQGGYYCNNWYYSGGGGSGYVNSGFVYLNKGEQVTITIGAGGEIQENQDPDEGTVSGKTGGTTSFGTYMSAAGGGGGVGVKTGNRSTTYTWAGGAGFNPGNAGYGGGGGQGGSGFYPGVNGGNQYGKGGDGGMCNTERYNNPSNKGLPGVVEVSWY